MTLDPAIQTPAPWVNVMANPNFGTMVSESGAVLPGLATVSATV